MLSLLFLSQFWSTFGGKENLSCSKSCVCARKELLHLRYVSDLTQRYRYSSDDDNLFEVLHTSEPNIKHVCCGDISIASEHNAAILLLLTVANRLHIGVPKSPRKENWFLGLGLEISHTDALRTKEMLDGLTISRASQLSVWISSNVSQESSNMEACALQLKGCMSCKEFIY